MKYCSDCGGRRLTQIKKGLWGGQGQRVGCRDCHAIFEQTIGRTATGRSAEQWRKLEEQLTLFDLGSDADASPRDPWATKTDKPESL